MKKSISFLLLLVMIALYPVKAQNATLPVVGYATDLQGNIIWESAVDESVDAVFALRSADKNKIAETAELPTSYDSRDEGIVTPVRSQGITSVCWAIAATDQIAVNLQKKALDSTVFSPAHLAWFAHRSLVYSADRTAGDGTLVKDPYSHGGNWLDAAAAMSAWNGPALDSDFPFNEQNISGMGNYTEASRFVKNAVMKSATCYYAKENAAVADISDTQMQKIKQAILHDGAVQLSFYSDTDYFNSNNNQTAYYQNVQTITNHAVTVVGWDDEFSRENFKSDCRPRADGAWLCKNSWGVLWGDEGYFWLSYEEHSLNQIVSFTATTQYDYDDIYQYDGFGFHGRVYSDSYIRFANVFTADEDCEIAAVGVWFLQDGADYTVEVFTGLEEGMRAPIKAVNAGEISGVAENYGYRIIDLRAPVAVNAGERFSVCVTLKTNENCPVVNCAIENKDADDYVSHSEAGQSYVQIVQNGPWYDTHTEGLHNVCLKAITLHEHSSAAVGSICTECKKTVSLDQTPLFRRFLAFFWSFVGNMT